MKGFTLTELLVVVAIIAVLCALLRPVLTGPRENANRASAISNMRQCILAVNQYREQFDRFPLLAEARQITPAAVTWDPNDTWRRDRREEWPLMLGSFGYAFTEPTHEDLYARMGGGTREPVLVSIFYSRPTIPAFQGDMPKSDGSNQFLMPERVLVGRADGSVALEPVPHLVERAGEHQGFSWSSMFFALAGKK